MLARFLLTELCMELILFSLVGVWLGAYAGWTPSLIVFAVVGLSLGIRVLLVGLMFAIAWVYRGVRPPPLQIGPVQTAILLGQEVGAFLALYLLLHPLGSWLARWRPSPSLPQPAIPVLFIHGLLCNAGYWWAMERGLRRRGVTNLFTLTLEPLFADIDRYADQVAERVEDICTQTKSQQLILVGHSMGGLVARAYAHRFAERGRVAKIITLGSPHHGTRHAPFCLPQGTNIRQMWLNNAWLKALNSELNSTVQPVAITSIYSCHDNLITPQDSSHLAHGHNIPVAGVGHLTMTFSRRFQDLVYAEIMNAGAA